MGWLACGEISNISAFQDSLSLTGEWKMFPRGKVFVFERVEISRARNYQGCFRGGIAIPRVRFFEKARSCFLQYARLSWDRMSLAIVMAKA